MTDIKRWRISFKQAVYLALFVLIIYYPITIYVNVPGEYFRQVATLLIRPAMFNVILYTLFILATDRLVDWFENLFRGKIISEFKLSTFLLSIPFAILSTAIVHLILSSIPIPKEQDGLLLQMTPQQMENFIRTNDGLTLMTFLAIFHIIINRKANIRMKDLEVEAQQLVKENALAQYEALKNQVSPHFLFNSLSILSSLVHVDSELSEKFIDRLSRAYRYILEQKDNDTIALKTELDFIASYSFLLKIRFENKFDVKVSVSDEDAEKYRIAPLTLQLLVENAVKHNRMSVKEPLQVTILIEENNLVILNPIRQRNENEKVTSTGIGLNNIINRYSLLTDKPVLVTSTHGTFIVKIPLL